MPLRLPDFPWDELDTAKAQAAAHPDGLIDLSVGSPVDPTPAFLQESLAANANAPAYPTVLGSLPVRQAMASWWQEHRGAGAVGVECVIPTVGSKEMVGLLPLLLGLSASDVVVHPSIAYPTYEIGALVVGATPVAEDDPERWPAEASLIWLNSPSNPTGAVLDVGYLRSAVAAAREIGAVLVNDECYAMLGSTTQPVAPSLLSDTVTDGNLTGLLSLYSLSKQSHLAGYRAAMLAGSADLIQSIVLPRRHLGLMVPEPIQQVIASALQRADHVESVRGLYQRRRALLAPAIERAGWRIEGGDAGLYLWITRDTSSSEAVSWFAERGILVAPGHFYGPGGHRHVRVALTAMTENIEAAAVRISANS